MAQMCRFDDASTEQTVFVNPTLVRFVRQDPDGFTRIHFDDNQFVTVRDKTDHVVKQLDVGL